MKILHIISSLSGGGRERRMVQLVKGLDSMHSSEIEQYIITFDPKIGYTEVIGHAEIVTFNYFDKAKCLKLLRTTMMRIRPDVVHDWTGVPLVVLSIALMKNKLKFKFVEGFVADGNKIDGIKLKAAAKIGFKIADVIVSNSKAGLIAKHAPLSKSKVIYNGFDYSRLDRATDEDIANLRLELGIAENQKIISMAARMGPAKDWDMFLDIVKVMSADRPSLCFLAVGKGELLQPIKNKIETLGLSNVKVLGYRQDVEKIMKASYITLLFSNERVHAEGVSNSIMESMACGVPVIASAGGGTPEIITDTEDGYIINPGNTSEACDKIKFLVDNEDIRNHMSLKASEKIRNKFLLGQMVDSYLNIYKTI